MKTFRKESLLLRPVWRFLQSEGFVHAKKELPFFEYKIDLYAYSPDRATSVAVELKLTRWRRAVEQALRYQLCADLVFIAVPKKTVGRVDVSKLAEYGIGLISVSPETRTCAFEKFADRSDVMLPKYRDSYRRLLTRERT